MERDLRKQYIDELAPNRKFKKRHKKDLSPEEISTIVATTKQPFRLYKDVAKQFRISQKLLCDLVYEAKKKPERIQK